MSLFDFFKKKSSKVNGNTFNFKKDNIYRTLMQSISQKTPSEHFASGSIFDIIRKSHSQFSQIVNTFDIASLKDFFVSAYVTFINHPQIVGFAPSMVDKNKNDTDPRTWNVDIMKLSSGERAALCFMPVNNDVYEARIVGIVLGNEVDKYYYCMLNKDENMQSDVIQNKALFGIEKIGSVKGRGFELINSFIKCIESSEPVKMLININNSAQNNPNGDLQLILHDKELNKKYISNPGSFWVGRDKQSCAIVINDIAVGCRHSIFTFENGKWYIETFSLSGTLINGILPKIRGKQELNVGDELNFAGKKKLYVEKKM